MQRCSKPGCGGIGDVVLAYDYARRRAVLSPHSPGEISPHLYLLCSTCADRLRPPRGWDLHDLRGDLHADAGAGADAAMAGAGDARFAS